MQMPGLSLGLVVLGYNWLLGLMDNNFFAYLQRLELMAFFSGYALVYAIVFIFVKRFFKNISIERVLSLLPVSYALCGILYIGLQVRNLYPTFSFAQFKENLYQPFLVCWGLLSTSFLVPALRKRPFLTVLHSLVFFFFILRDLYRHSFISPQNEVVKNDMKVYADSVLLNLGSFVLVVFVYWWFSRLVNWKQAQLGRKNMM